MNKVKVGASLLAILLPFLAVHEGVFKKAYRDPIGIPTICMGSTSNVKMGDIATQEECDERSEVDIQEAYNIFVRHVPEKVRLSMSDKTTASFVSFIFNVGPGKKGVKDGFVVLKSGRQSTMLTNLKSGRIKAACYNLLDWTSAGGVKLRGLENRRKEELKLCLSTTN